MKIKKLSNGSTKVELENGQIFFIRRGIDPIDGMIEIGLIQQKTTSFLNKPASADDDVMPIKFLFVLGRKCFKEVGEMQKDEDWHEYVAQKFNLEISQQEQSRTGKVVNAYSYSFTTEQEENLEDNGKYFICYQDVLPEFLSRTPEQIDNEECHYETEATDFETMKYVIALSLLRLLHAKLDVRKIEARISELKGMCDYLRMIVPDEFNAYCLVVDRLGMDAELDIDLNYELLERIIQE